MERTPDLSDWLRDGLDDLHLWWRTTLSIAEGSKMSNTTTTAFMLIQARSCLTNAVRPLSSKPRELDWANRIFRASDLLHKIYNEIMEFEELEETMDKQINKLKKVTKTNNTKKRKSGKRS